MGLGTILSRNNGKINCLPTQITQIMLKGVKITKKQHLWYLSKLLTYPEVCTHDHREDFAHCLITELIHSNDVEMSQETRRHIISASTRGTHCSKELDIL